MKCLCVYIEKTAGEASLFRKLGREQKRGHDEGRGESREVFSSSLPLPLLPFVVVVVVVAVFAIKRTFVHLLDWKRLLHMLRQEKSSTTQQDWFGTATKPPFHCLGTPIWWT